MLKLVDSNLMILQWTIPFTWPYTNIDHYVVSSNNTLQNWNRSRVPNTNTFLELQVGDGEAAVQCAVYSFTVLANNGLANGEAAIVTGGFPIGKDG